MAFDGSAWNESSPTNNDLANEIDDYMRDDKIAVRGRMAHEHIWGSSQSATNESGQHKFITFQGQTAAPGLVLGTNTQQGALYVSSGDNDLIFVDSAGSEYVVFSSGVGAVALEGTGAIGDMVYITSGGGFVALAAGTTNSIIVGQGTTTAPAYTLLSSLIGVAAGTVADGGTVALPSGFSSGQTKVTVGAGTIDVSGAGGAINQMTCSVDASRVVTFKANRFNWVNSSVNSTGSGTANYIIIGVRT